MGSAGRRHRHDRHHRLRPPQLGDVVYVELPEIGRQVEQGKEAAVVESVKAASESTPRSRRGRRGQRRARRRTREGQCRPEGGGWFVKLRLAEPKQLDALMDEAAYSAFRGAATDALPAADRQLTAPRCWRRSACRHRRAVSRRAASARGSTGFSTCRWRRASWRSSARSAELAAQECRRRRRRLSSVGAGAYRHHVPAAVDHLIQRARIPDLATRPISRRSRRGPCRTCSNSRPRSRC